MSKSSLMALAALCLLIFTATNASATTIVKVGLSETGPDVEFVGGVFSTVNDGVPSTTGEQNTDVDFVGILSFLADITGISNASFTLDGIAASGAATETSLGGGASLITQATSGGHFELYGSNDPSQINTLLLSGTLTNGVISGTDVGATGNFFTTTVGSFTGGSLLAYLTGLPGVELSFALGSIMSGNVQGLEVCEGALSDFTANADGLIDASEVPEPASLALILAGLLGGAAVRRRKLV